MLSRAFARTPLVGAVQEGRSISPYSISPLMCNGAAVCLWCNSSNKLGQIHAKVDGMDAQRLRPTPYSYNPLSSDNLSTIWSLSPMRKHYLQGTS